LTEAEEDAADVAAYDAAKAEIAAGGGRILTVEETKAAVEQQPRTSAVRRVRRKARNQ
jgi:hypothetical protein